MRKKERYTKVVNWFQTNMPIAETELNYKTPYELMVSVILSAQCTDKRVNLITPSFFVALPDLVSLAKASQDEVFEIIRSCSYPNNKAKHLRAAANTVISDFNGEIPETVDELQKIPGVGRKTANVVLNEGFGVPTIAVDTHVFRVANRTGLAPGKTVLETELKLLEVTPKKWLKNAHHYLILHGRYTCTAKNFDCQKCVIKKECAFKEKG